MKVMTYNILGGWQDRIDLIVDTIISESPDYLVLNEANSMIPDIYGHLKKFMSSTSLSYAAAAPSGKDTFHVILMSKKPIRYCQFLTPLVRAGVLILTNSEFGDLTIVGTHLTPYAETERLIEIKRILQTIKHYDNVILLGDFNSLAYYDDYSHLKIEQLNHLQKTKFTKSKKFRYDVISEIINKGFIDCAQLTNQTGIKTTPTSITSDIAHENMRLDYIFVSQSLSNYISSYSVIKNNNTEIASDHYPIIAQLKKEPENLSLERNSAIDKVWFNFKWDIKKVWKLDIPVEQMPIQPLIWHLNIPLWEYNGKIKSITPLQVIENQHLDEMRYKRIMAADLNYPLDVMWWNNRWMMLDGVHRLAKAVILKKKRVKVRKISHQMIPNIV